MLNNFYSLTVLVASACLALLSPTTQAQDQALTAPADPVVIWSRTNFAPFFILEGEYRNQGISDNLIKAYTRRIKNYRHQPMEMTLARMLNNARNGIPTCHVALLKTPKREAYIEYSNPVMITYANGIITTEHGLAAFGLSPDFIPDINLANLSGKPLSIMAEQGRSYSPVLDSFIQSEAGKENSVFQVENGSKSTVRRIRLLMAGRLDGFLGRPEEAHFNSVSNEIREPLYIIGIKGQKKVSLARVGCTRGEWNDALLEQVNAMVLDPEIRGVIDGSFQRWLPEQLRQQYVIDKSVYFSSKAMVFNP